MYQDYYQGKIVIITGGGSGLGRALSIRLAQAGARVICSDIDLSGANRTVSIIAGDAAVARKLDVTDLSEFERLIDQVAAEYGRVDLVFNNAGISVSGELRDISAADWKRIMDINFYGVLNGSQTSYLQMLKQGHGQIVNTASAAGLAEYMTLLGPYSVSKHAVVNYTKILRAEARQLGIRCSVVCPGFIQTSIGENGIAPNASQEWNDLANWLVSRGMAADKAADKILKGVRRNKEVIIFPPLAKLVVRFTRLFAGLFKIAIQRQLKGYRIKYRVSR